MLLDEIHLNLFSTYAQQITGAADAGAVEEQGLAEILMRDLYGIDSTRLPDDILFDYFITITHKPPSL